MTEAELMELVYDAPSYGLPCVMTDGRIALLVFNPIEGNQSRNFGFQVPGEEEIRWRAAEKIAHCGGGALAEVET